jgi:hypothetical protein
LEEEVPQEHSERPQEQGERDHQRRLEDPPRPCRG